MSRFHSSLFSPTSARRALSLSIALLFLFGSLAWADIPPPKKKAKDPTAFAEMVFGLFNKGQFAKAYALMAPSVHKVISLKKLTEGSKRAMAVTGKYVAGSLKLRKTVKRGKLRIFVFSARFTKEKKGRATMALDPKGRVASFVVRTPKLIKAAIARMKKGVKAAAKPSGAAWKTLEGLTDGLMTNFNKNNLAGFCAHCTDKMKQVFTKTRFDAFTKAMKARIGSYVSRTFTKAEKAKKSNYLIMWYHATFKKRKLYVRVVYQPKGKGFLVAGLRFSRKLF